jgi:hypothetical protein
VLRDFEREDATARCAYLIGRKTAVATLWIIFTTVRSVLSATILDRTSRLPIILPNSRSKLRVRHRPCDSVGQQVERSLAVTVVGKLPHRYLDVARGVVEGLRIEFVQDEELGLVLECGLDHAAQTGDEASTRSPR